MTAPTPREQLCKALIKTLERQARRHPELQAYDVCAAIGIAAGTVVGLMVPLGMPEADILSGEVIGIAYAQGITSVRQRAAS